MHIEKVDTLTDEIVDAVQRLVPEIGAHKPLPTHEELAALIRSAASTLIVARYPDAQGPIAGMLTVTVYQVPTGIRSIVEDVAVDSNFRRMGIAKALMETALLIAKGAGANGVALTSNPKREAANRLYQSMGFERRETNAYMYRFHEK
jgi:ribosomal protein S18 acetylase RimI-like enzyme